MNQQKADFRTCSVFYDGCNKCDVIEINLETELINCETNQCLKLEEPRCVDPKTDLDYVVKSEMFGPKNANGGQIDDW